MACGRAQPRRVVDRGTRLLVAGPDGKAGPRAGASCASQLSAPPAKSACCSRCRATNVKSELNRTHLIAALAETIEEAQRFRTSCAL